MNYMQESLIAKQIIELLKENDIISTSKYNDKGVLEENSYSLKEALSYLLSTGVSMFIMTDRENLLIREIIESELNEELKVLCFETISKRQLDILPYNIKTGILFDMSIADMENHMEYLFKNGFRLDENNINKIEIDMIYSRSVAFFELIGKYQPDFNFQQKYPSLENYTILEHIKSDMENGGNGEKIQQIELLIKNLIKVQNYKSLSKELEVKGEPTSKLKI